MKKMKLALTGLFALVLISACGGCKKTSPEDEVRNYSKYFIDKVTANELDSIKASYPEILEADSIVPLQSDTIVITETQTPGLYEVTLAEGVTLKVNRSEDGNITVKESKGLFAYPSDKVEIAKKTGMWDNQLNDAQLAERMKDEEFFNSISQKTNVNPNKLITVGSWNVSQEWLGNDLPGKSSQTVTNNTDVPISGSDYVFVMISNDPYSAASGESPRTWTNPGKDIPANGSIRENFEIYSQSAPAIARIQWKLSPEQIQEKFFSFTGNEYQEYLDSKK